MSSCVTYCESCGESFPHESLTECPKCKSGNVWVDVDEKDWDEIEDTEGSLFD